ncbi:unnamed protein product [Diatraea saccharalis]|uniref:FP protein C-terminal domain-containing protein n=1 Tax=Diatraea saccharalis TaxID=40085 RepID=A0A9N9WGG8_9NEOP|nr:unnamed protein product [Diatraea saccharalis]
MQKCGGCGKFISASAAAKCNCCPNVFHRVCVAIPDGVKISTTWECPDCVVKRPKTDNSATPVKSVEDGYRPTDAAPSGYVDIDHVQDYSFTGESLNNTALDQTQPFRVELSLELRLFREEMRQVREEFAEFRRELAGVYSALGRLDELENRLLALEQHHDKHEARISALEKSRELEIPENMITSLQRTVAELKQELSTREQEALVADLEISNVPEVRGENTIHTVCVLAKRIGVELDERDIVFAERVGVGGGRVEDGTEELRPRRIVMRLTRRHMRDELLRAARVRRSATTEAPGLPTPPRRFYINERLTSANREIFRQARATARSLGWRYVWTRRGRVYVRQADGRPRMYLRSVDDMVGVFGLGTVSSELSK